MKVLLVDLSPKSKNRSMPSLALLKLSTFYKNKGDDVKWVEAGQAPSGKFDKILFSSIFLSTLRNDISYIKSYSEKYPDSEILVGGPNLSLRGDIFKEKLKNKNVKFHFGLLEEIETVAPDFDIANINYSYGFTSRGCCNKCPWCVVPITEGQVRPIKNWQNTVNLKHKLFSAMDNNVLACGEDHFESVLKWCQERGIYFEFNQAMDVHLFYKNPNFFNILNKYKGNLWQLFFSWDSMRQDTSAPEIAKKLNESNLKGKNDFNLWYVLYGHKDKPSYLWKRLTFLLDHRQKVKLMRFKDIETGSYSANWFGFDQHIANFMAKVSVSGILEKNGNRDHLLNDYESFVRFVLGVNLFRSKSLACIKRKDIKQEFESVASKVPKSLVDRILQLG